MHTLRCPETLKLGDLGLLGVFGVLGSGGVLVCGLGVCGSLEAFAEGTEVLWGRAEVCEVLRYAIYRDPVVWRSCEACGVGMRHVRYPERYTDAYRSRDML